MARTKKNAEDEVVTADIPKDDVVKTQAEVENEELRKQLADLQAQMAMMAQMIATGGKADEADTKAKSKRRIPFYNMTPNTLILRGTRSHRIEGQFNKDTYPENEAAAIVANMPNAIRNGLVYIADAKFVEEQELDAIYETIMSNEQLKDLLNHDSQYVIDVYKSANKGQQTIIIDMIEQGRLNGKEIDANILMQLGHLSGKDLMNIEPLTIE